MALMYCYGSGFHVSKNRSKCVPDPMRLNGAPPPCTKNAIDTHDVVTVVRVLIFTVPPFPCSSLTGSKKKRLRINVLSLRELKSYTSCNVRGLL